MARHSENPDDPEEIIPLTMQRSKSLGETVTIKGIVTANLKNTIANTRSQPVGLQLRPASLDASVGDEVTVTGKLVEL